MAKRARASRESVAYQDSIYRETLAREEALHVVQIRNKRRALRIQHLLCIAFTMCVAGVLLYSQVRLTSVTQQVSDKNEQLEALNNEYISLRAQQGKSLSLDFVEEYAQNSLGMVKLDANAVEYVEMNNPDRIEVNQTESKLSGAVAGLVKSFSIILEYFA